MKILVTGGCGYIGSMLVKKLTRYQNEVIVLDNLMYNQGHLIYSAIKHPYCIFHKTDITKDSLFINLIKHVDIIIPLAALVGAPLCDKHPEEAVEINEKIFEKMMRVINDNQKIIYLNSNSGYGITQDEYIVQPDKICTEETPLNPISLYGQTKAAAEKIILQHPNTVVFRLATVFGTSFRQRLDLLVNSLTYDAFFNKQIELFEGNFYRNFVHIDDVVDGINCAIRYEQLNSNVFNLGLDNANMTKQELVETIMNYAPHDVTICKINKHDPDKRNYLVSSEKLKNNGFSAYRNLQFGIQQLNNFYSLLPIDKEKRDIITIPMRNYNTGDNFTNTISH